MSAHCMISSSWPFFPKIIKFSQHLTKLWEKTILAVFFPETRCRLDNVINTAT